MSSTRPAGLVPLLGFLALALFAMNFAVFLTRHFTHPTSCSLPARDHAVKPRVHAQQVLEAEERAWIERRHEVRARLEAEAKRHDALRAAEAALHEAEAAHQAAARAATAPPLLFH